MMYSTLFQKNGSKNRQQQQQHKSITTRRNVVVVGSGSHSLHRYHSPAFVRYVVVLLFLGSVVLLMYLYIRIVTLHMTHSQQHQQQSSVSSSVSVSSSSKQRKPSILASFLTTLDNNNNNNNNNNKENHQNVHYFRQIAVELAKYTPSDILYELNEYDPFGVRKIIPQIQMAELYNHNQTISFQQIQSIFPCPTISLNEDTTTSHTGSHTRSRRTHQHQHRMTYPELRNMTKFVHYQQQMFDLMIQEGRKDHTNKNNVENYFIYFQHLRKAGGTHFCTLAQQNIPSQYVPDYYCMPDYYWIPESYTNHHNKISNKKYEPCAGCLHRYSTTEIIQQMSHYKIAGNEWDHFDVTQHFDLPAIYITSFRQPLHRFVSQYRFECVEARGCTANNIDTYWTKRRDLYNIYTSTFSDVPTPLASISFAPIVAAAQLRSKAMAIAYDTILQFHLVLIMELLPYSEQLVQTVLGFRDTSILSQRVRPHNNGKNHRTDSWTPEQLLTTEQYTKMSESLALDEILYDVARRIFLERLVCSN